MWNVPDGRQVGESHKYTLPIHSVVYAQDGGSLLLGRGNSILLTDASTGQVHERTDALMFSRAVASQPEQALTSLTFSRIAQSGSWISRLGKMCPYYEDTWLKWMRPTFSADGRRLASGGKDRTVKVWDLTRESEVHVLAPVRPVTRGVAFNSRGTQLALASDWTGLPADQDAAVRVLAPDTGREVLRVRGAMTLPSARTGLAGHRNPRGVGNPLGHRDGSGSPYARQLGPCFLPPRRQPEREASGVGLPRRNHPGLGSLRWRLIRTWRGHSGRIEGVALSPDGSRLATTGPESGVLLWDTESGIRVRSLEDPSSFSTVAISPDGHLIAAAGIDRVIRLWDVSTGRPVGYSTVTRTESTKWPSAQMADGSRRQVLTGRRGSGMSNSGVELLALPGVSMPVSGITFESRWNQNRCY